MKTRQAKDWWTATFCDPASWAILAVCGDWAWLTPNRISVVSFMLRAASALMIAVGEGPMLLWAVVVMQVGVVLDHADGNLARYRKISSLSGGFIDRIFDGASFLLIISALGWLAHQQGEPAWYAVMGAITGGMYLLICYMYWSFAYYEWKEVGHSRGVSPGAIQAEIAATPTWKLVVQGQHRIIYFNQIDFYFWMSLALLVGRPHWGVLMLWGVLTVKAVARFHQRHKALVAIENRERP